MAQHSVMDLPAQVTDIEDAVTKLLNAAVVMRGSGAGTRIELECTMCGQREENHTTACPVPALEEWLNAM